MHKIQGHIYDGYRSSDPYFAQLRPASLALDVRLDAGAVLAYLVTLLLVWVVPSMFFGGTPALELELFVMFGLPLLFLAMAFMPTEQDTVETPQIVDFFYATLLFLLFVVLVLGTFAFMRVGNLPYATSLTYSILISAGVLLLLSLAWNPRAGFAGLSMYFSRYLLSIGLPFERWLYFLAEQSQMESRPDRFLKESGGGAASSGATSIACVISGSSSRVMIDSRGSRLNVG